MAKKLINLILMLLLINQVASAAYWKTSIDRTIVHEGSALVSNKKEISRYGITSTFLKEFNKKHKKKYKVRTLTKKQAEYAAKAYWSKYNLWMIEDQDIADQVYDWIYNAGPKAIKQIQETINECNYYSGIRTTVAVDGAIGNETFEAINNLTIHHKVLLNETMIKNRLMTYIYYSGWAKNKNGWSRRIKSYSIRN